LKSNAGPVVDFLSWHPFECFVKHTLRPHIAIMVRVSEQLAGSVQQSKVNAPGINPYGCNAAPLLVGKLQKPLLHLPIQTENIPVRMTGEINRIIGKAVQLLHLQAAAVKSADQSPSAAGTQIKSYHVQFFHFLHLTLPISSISLSNNTNSTRPKSDGN
jgi:hypothetical protein